MNLKTAVAPETIIFKMLTSVSTFSIEVGLLGIFTNHE